MIPAEAFEAKILATCQRAGLEAMVGPLLIVRDREEVDEQALLDLTPQQVSDLYDAHIAPAIDQIEDLLLDEEGDDDG